MSNTQKKKRKKKQRDDAELVACRLAYEAGVHWLDANVRALEAMRTRALALVSVMLLASTFAANFASDAAQREALGACGWIGVALFVLGTAVAIAAGVFVAWTATFTAELGPRRIIERHVDPNSTWPSARVYRAIAEDLDGYAKKSRELLRKRANSYKWSLIGVPVGVVGLGLLWVDVTF